MSTQVKEKQDELFEAEDRVEAVEVEIETPEESAAETVAEPEPEPEIVWCYELSAEERETTECLNDWL